MLEAINQHLDKAKPAAAAEGGDKSGAAAKKDGAAVADNPKKNDKGDDLDHDGKVIAKTPPKVKTSAELELSPEERKVLGVKAQARFGEVITALKEREGTIEKQAVQIKGLTEARDAIVGLMEETRTSQEALGQYLEFNMLATSNDPKQVEQALHILEAQRAALYTRLGREPADGGIDLLAEFPDLQKQVADEEIKREAALEIAASRREKAARQKAAELQQQQKTQSEQTQKAAKEAAEKALTDIETWTAGLKKSDLDYKAKEDRLLAKLDGVLKNYPPDKWLATLQLLYEGIEIPKGAAPAGGGKPLRPSGAKPGAKAPSNMLDAINLGLGYQANG